MEPHAGNFDLSKQELKNYSHENNNKTLFEIQF